MSEELNFHSNSSDHLPPQNIEAEEAILGGILLDPEAISRISDRLVPEAFYISAHKDIYQAALRLHSQGKPTDLLSLTSWLADQDKLARIGGRNKLASLIDRTVSAVNIDILADLVTEKYLRRQLIKAGNEVVQLAYETETALPIVLDQAEQKVFGVTQERPQAGLIHISDTLINTFQDIETRHQGIALPGIPCGFYDLDAMTSGFQRSDLIIVAGRPSMGKCVAYDTEILLADGSISTIEEIYHRRQADLLTLTDDGKLEMTQPSAFVDDGIKPVFRVTTRLGRCVETTITHPYLTSKGWQRLEELKVGDKIAVPRKIDVFGTNTIPECEVKLLAYLEGDGCLTDTTPEFTNINPLIQDDFSQAVLSFSPQLEVRREVHPQRSPILYAAGCQGHKNPLTAWLENLALWGKKADDKIIPDLIFQLERSLVSLFLNRLFATDGWVTVLTSSQSQLGYCTVSEKLARQVQHLLLRFGIIAALTPVPPEDYRKVCSCAEEPRSRGEELTSVILQREGSKKQFAKYKHTRRQAWQLDITDANSIKTFICEIGIFGKEKALGEVEVAINQKRSQTNYEKHTSVRIHPSEYPMPCVVGFKHGKIASPRLKSGALDHHSSTSRTEFHSEFWRLTPEFFFGNRDLTQERLWTLATTLDNLPIQRLPTSDVYWDEIVSIESMGNKQVYDLTIPVTHNFVANDICVHNTAFCLNLAHNIASSYKLPIAVFSLEMSKEQLVQRLLASEAGIETGYLRSGRISQTQWEPLSRAIGLLSEIPIFIDDTPNITVTEMRSQARRLQAEVGAELGLIIIDYLQLMEGAGDNRVQELSRITRSLKGLARELSVPIIALSQLSRGVESRTNKRPMLSDLRESGSIEQDADIVIMLYRDDYYNSDTPDRGIAEVIIAKHRNGPTGTVKLLFDPQFTKFKNLARPNAH